MRPDGCSASSYKGVISHRWVTIFQAKMQFPTGLPHNSHSQIKFRQTSWSPSEHAPDIGWLVNHWTCRWTSRSFLPMRNSSCLISMPLFDTIIVASRQLNGVSRPKRMTKMANVLSAAGCATVRMWRRWLAICASRSDSQNEDAARVIMHLPCDEYNHKPTHDVSGIGCNCCSNHQTTSSFV